MGHPAALPSRAPAEAAPPASWSLRRHVGKTTTCLGLVDGGPDGRLRVDKDCVLFKEHFRLGCPYRPMSPSNDVIVVEGTGHAGVGAVVELHNARVAQLLGIPAVLIGTGGIGSAIDQLMLSKTLFEQHGVPIKGVIVNKVIPDKRDMVEKYVRKVLIATSLDAFTEQS
eukprot:gene7778-20666_t